MQKKLFHVCGVLGLRAKKECYAEKKQWNVENAVDFNFEGSSFKHEPKQFSTVTAVI